MATNPDKLKLVTSHSHKATLFSIARMPKTSRVFVGASDFKVYEADLAQQKVEFKEIGGHESYVTGVTLAEKALVSGGYDGKLIWWDTDTRKQIRSVDAHGKWIRMVITTPDNKKVVSVADDMHCKIWEASTGKLLHDLKGHEEKTPHHFQSMLYAVAMSPNGKHLATGDKVGKIVIWELDTGKQVTTLSAAEMYTWDPVQRRHSIGGIRSLAFSPDNSLLAVGGMGKVGNIDHLEGNTRIEVFDWQAGKQTHLFPGDKYKGLINHVEFDPKGEWLLGAGGAGDGHMQFHDLKTKKVTRQEKVAMHVHDLVPTEDSETMYVVGTGKLAVYELKS